MIKFPKKLTQVKLFGHKVSLFRNTTARRFGAAKLPIRQRLLWLGPVFVLVKG